MAPEERPFSLNICICIINHYRLQVSGCVYCLVIFTHYNLHIDIQSYLKNEVYSSCAAKELTFKEIIFIQYSSIEE